MDDQKVTIKEWMGSADAKRLGARLAKIFSATAASDASINIVQNAVIVETITIDTLWNEKAAQYEDR